MTEQRLTAAVDDIRAAATAPPLADGVWSVDPRQGEIGFAVTEMWGLRTVRGVFRACGGSLLIREGGAAGELTIDTGSLDTGNDRRDQHLRSPSFFDVERHPRIVFTATGVTARQRGLTVEGELAIGCTRVQLAIPVDVQKAGEGALRFEAETTVSRKAAGIAWNKLGMISDDAVLHVQLTLERAGRDEQEGIR